MALLDQSVDRRSSANRPQAAAERAARGPLPSFLASRPDARSGNDNQQRFFDQGPAVELDCLRRMLAPELLDAAEARSRQVGVGAEQILIQSGAIDESGYLRRLARHAGIAVDDLAGWTRADTPLLDRQMPFAAESGILPLRKDGRLIHVFAPRRWTVRTLCRLAAAHPHLRQNIRLTTAACLQQFLTRQGGAALGHIAARGLYQQNPWLSAAPTVARSSRWQGRLRRGGSVVAAIVLPPTLAPGIFTVLLAVWFLGFAALRLVAACQPNHLPRRRQRVADHVLPTYSIVIALYHESSSVAPLLQAIEALDYPREKLDVLLVVEPDDLATREAIVRLGPMPHVQLLIAPPRAPQTKPKALNWALPFVRGSLVAVFDAEDRPEPGQLRTAFEVLCSGGERIACAQASLCIDNETHSWLSRMFTAEYAGQFDVVLPGMSAMRLPLPLGGSSNHFRTDVLREIGGWDSYNVTEDADLGFRLARHGFRSTTFSSTTFEEAPIRFGNWLRQRSRWMKGWLQTWCVHMRQPRKLWHDLGPCGFLALNLVAGGNLLTALAYPVLLYLLVTDALGRAMSWQPVDWPWLHLVAVGLACVSTITVGLMGLSRRGRLRDGWILVWTPVYWGCLSIAAWRALLHYVWNPYHWEKTEHGVAKRRNIADILGRRAARKSHK